MARPRLSKQHRYSQGAEHCPGPVEYGPGHPHPTSRGRFFRIDANHPHSNLPKAGITGGPWADQHHVTWRGNHGRRPALARSMAPRVMRRSPSTTVGSFHPRAYMAVSAYVDGLPSGIRSDGPGRVDGFPGWNLVSSLRTQPTAAPPDPSNLFIQAARVKPLRSILFRQRAPDQTGKGQEQP